MAMRVTGKDGKLRLATAGLAAFLVASLAWAGGDPWKEKPYQQWDEKDIKKILQDSPWAKLVRVDALWRGLSVGNVAGGESGTPAREMPSGTEPGYNPSQPGQPQRGQYGGEQNPVTAYLVRWYSSRTIRRAAVRSAILAGRMKEADAEKALAQPVQEYQIVVFGPDMTPLAQAKEEELKSKSYLMAKKTKEKLQPDRIEVGHGPDGKTVTAVVFYFSKKAANGEPVIGSGEKTVEFVCHVTDLSLEVNFDLRKMTDAEGLDL